MTIQTLYPSSSNLLASNAIYGAHYQEFQANDHSLDPLKGTSRHVSTNRMVPKQCANLKSIIKTRSNLRGHLETQSIPWIDLQLLKQEQISRRFTDI